MAVEVPKSPRLRNRMQRLAATISKHQFWIDEGDPRANPEKLRDEKMRLARLQEHCKTTDGDLWYAEYNPDIERGVPVRPVGYSTTHEGHQVKKGSVMKVKEAE